MRRKKTRIKVKRNKRIEIVKKTKMRRKRKGREEEGGNKKECESVKPKRILPCSTLLVWT